MSSNLPWLDAIDCAERIRSREISAVEVAELLLRRIERLNPRLNAIVCLSPRVINDAERADTAVRRGTKLGPLHGVPFTVKDALDVAGYPATRGSRLFADHVAKADATAVTRLKRAGGIFLGKTNLPEFGLWWETENALFGRPVNPWDETRPHWANVSRTEGKGRPVAGERYPPMGWLEPHHTTEMRRHAQRTSNIAAEAEIA